MFLLIFRFSTFCVTFIYLTFSMLMTSMLVIIGGNYCYHFECIYPFYSIFWICLEFWALLTKKGVSISKLKYFWSYCLWKTWLFKGIKYSISENPSTVNVLTTCSGLLYNGFQGGTLANSHAMTECHTRKRSSCFYCHLGVKAVIVISFLFLDCGWKQHVFLYFN